MAPRTRSNRAEKLVNERLLAKGILPNSHGFAALPNELYLEILSQFPTMPLPQVVWFKEETDPYRHITLLALSQTCRSLRSVFLRYAWERIEVFGGMWTRAGRLPTYSEQRKRGYEMQRIIDTKFSKEALHQFETVTVRNPELGQHVRIVNVMFVHSSHNDAILSEIAQSLSLLRHVDTLQITSPSFYLTKTTFAQYSYPQLHTLCLHGPLPCGDILLACPNLKTFTADGRIPLPPLLETCPSHLQVLGVRSTASKQISLGAIISRFPRLRDMALDVFLLRTYEGNLSCLSSLPLDTLRLYLDTPSFQPSYLPRPSSTVVECTRWIEMAKKVLAMCPTSDDDVRKRVVVINDDKTVTTHFVIS